MDISRSHLSRDVRHKIRLLNNFKNAVAAFNPEFDDLDQKVHNVVSCFFCLFVSPFPGLSYVFKLLCVFVYVHLQDVHEFLTSVLYQMRSLEAQLRVKAASMGRTYSCPVEDHMLFKMQNVRTCKRYSYTEAHIHRFLIWVKVRIQHCGNTLIFKYWGTSQHFIECKSSTEGLVASSAAVS